MIPKLSSGLTSPRFDVLSWRRKDRESRGVQSLARAGPQLQTFLQHPRLSVTKALSIPGWFPHGLDFCPAMVPSHCIHFMPHKENFQRKAILMKEGEYHYLGMVRVCLIYCSHNWWFRNTTMMSFAEKLDSGNNVQDFKGNFSRNLTLSHLTTLGKNWSCI